MSLREQSVVFVGADKEKTERQVFEAFCEIHPNFAGRPLKDWERGADPPDILCHDISGKRIGVELTEWINEKQVASQKPQQERHASFSRIIRSDREIPPRNIEHVRLGLYSEALPVESEQGEFRRELFDCVRHVDATWNASPDSRSLQDYLQLAFPNHPILSKYVAWIKYWPCRPSERAPGIEWVRFPARGGFYTPKVMLDTLIENIRKKTAKYSTLHGRQALDEFYLIVYYDSKALLYNPPYSAPGIGFREVADAVCQELATNPGQFQKVFLFSPIEKKEKVLEIWPYPNYLKLNSDKM